MPNEPMRYEADNPEIKASLQELGKLIGSAMKQMPGWGFTLMLFSYGADGSMFYISSAQRQDMIKAMREFVQKYGAS